MANYCVLVETKTKEISELYQILYPYGPNANNAIYVDDLDEKYIRSGLVTVVSTAVKIERNGKINNGYIVNCDKKWTRCKIGGNWKHLLTTKKLFKERKTYRSKVKDLVLYKDKAKEIPNINAFALISLNEGWIDGDIKSIEWCETLAKKINNMNKKNYITVVDLYI